MKRPPVSPSRSDIIMVAMAPVLRDVLLDPVGVRQRVRPALGTPQQVWSKRLTYD